MVRRGGGRRGFRRLVRRDLARTVARCDGGGVCDGAAAASDPAVVLGALPRAPLEAGDDGLFRPRRASDGRRFRRGCRPVRALGVPARFHDSDLSGRSEGGDGECRLGAGRAADPAGRRIYGGDGVALRPGAAALRRRAVRRAARFARDAALPAAGRGRLPGDPRRYGGFGGQRVEGLFQLRDVPQPCGDEPRLFVSVESGRQCGLRCGLSLLRRADAGRAVRRPARKRPERGTRSTGARHAQAECRGGDSREFRPHGDGRGGGRRTGHAQHAAAEARRGVVRELLRPTRSARTAARWRS